MGYWLKNRPDLEVLTATTKGDESAPFATPRGSRTELEGRRHRKSLGSGADLRGRGRAAKRPRYARFPRADRAAASDHRKRDIAATAVPRRDRTCTAGSRSSRTPGSLVSCTISYFPRTTRLVRVRNPTYRAEATKEIQDNSAVVVIRPDSYNKEKLRKSYLIEKRRSPTP